jgi:hypothetical protein
VQLQGGQGQQIVQDSSNSASSNSKGEATTTRVVAPNAVLDAAPTPNLALDSTSDVLLAAQLAA